MKVLCIGHSAYDITLLLPQYPIENKKYSIDLVLECGGGPAGNAAFLIAKWGMSSGYAGVLGKDVYGMKIREELQQAGVDLRYLVWDESSVTPFSFILANESNGSRTLFNHNKKSNPKLQVQFEEEEPAVILADGHELPASLQAIEKYRSAVSVLDAGSYNPATRKLAEMVDWLVCSEDFATVYAGLGNLHPLAHPELFFEKLEKLNGKEIVVTLGEKGCLYKDNGRIVHQQAYKVNAIDTTGAGDIFHGAFAYCLAEGFDKVKTVKIASIAAALSVQKLGGRAAIPDLKEVLRLYEK